ncbi:MAG TPA: L-glutamate gamma-semialdehyde dehydrogenase [Saprospiraceae bacterium]|nr:L-glutamate gamma-semialdehyde dehydrogenase [Saprospiraceae bacterium]HNT20024.1 L-glutamate gamma-semialdehyde dehydrogenase [Saprospiraceae bacterium]
MSGNFKLPPVKNEPVPEYLPGSAEKLQLKLALAKAKSSTPEIKMTIGGKKISTGPSIPVRAPHDHQQILAYHSKGGKEQVKAAIQASLNAKAAWQHTPWEERAAVFLKAADLLSGPYRARMNAATMLGQSKNVFQSEIDAVAELADFFRFNVKYMTEIYATQPASPPGTWNRLEYRPLEGFVLAITPFNFTSIAGNLPGAPALLGNTVVWKPAETQIYSAAIIMEILEKAGLPDGVINMITIDGPSLGEVAFSHPDFAGLHFTGSTGVFNHLWQTIGNQLGRYKSYPRLVGETGGKDFVLMHASSDPKAVATALSRGAFEYQGQKCSAASRAYIPKSQWKKVQEYLLDDLASMTIGEPENFSHFINAVIDEKAFDKISSYITGARKSKDASLLAGGRPDKSKGYFIEPTVILANRPDYKTMVEEIFGPVLSIYVYEDKSFEDTLKWIDSTSPYALTGAVFATDRQVIQQTSRQLMQAAGNFYINDKPTGAVVNQQPFGGARGSGTNDKAGSILNLYRWLSPRTIKENFNPPRDYRYPFMSEE